MDWIRRNWPDLLIGIALVAVIAGIIATLLTGGSFFPLGGSDRPEGRSGSQSNLGAITGTVEAGVAGVQDDEVASSQGTTSATGGDATGNSGASGTTGDDAVADRSPGVTVLPFPGSEETSESTGVSSGPAGGQTGDALSNEASTEVEDRPLTTTGDDRSQEGGAASSTRASDTSIPAPSSTEAAGTYRVSVGAFSSRENAERQADIFRQAGYPVFIGTQGNLSIVLVGPYDERSEAEVVAGQIRSGNFDIEPVIYLFTPEDQAAEAAASAGTASETSASVSATTSSGPAESSSASTMTISETASEASGGRFLQVGAYGTAESAQPQRERLEGLGFRVTERVEGDLVKLLVGPFAGDEFTAARSRLNDQGIEHFPR